MKSSTGFSKWDYKRTGVGILLLLCLSLSTPPVAGQPFSGRNAPAQSLPPSTRVSPELINPNLPPAMPLELEGDRQSLPPLVPGDPVAELIDRGVFSPDVLARETPVTRAEFADVLVKALGHGLHLVSEFPFYRDVARDYWAYAPIEVARAKRLIRYPEGGGFYEPEKTVTYGEVYVAMSNALTGPPPTVEEIEQLMAGYEGADVLSEELRPAVAKLVRSRFFGAPGNLRPAPPPDEPVRAEELAPLVAYLMLLVENREPFLDADALGTLATLPVGLELSVSPTVGIFEDRMQVGQAFEFDLVYPVPPLPQGTRFRGTVRSIAEPGTYTIELVEARAPDGQTYRTSADLQIVFDQKEELNFVVPGEVFRAVTELPADMVPPPASSVLPAAPPSASSGNTSAPSSVPRSPE